jgi:nitroreductase
MEFTEVIQGRYSVRAYRQDPIDGSILNSILDAARLAPTAANRQPFRLLVVETAGREAELKRIYGRDWFVEAPVIVGVCAVLDEAWVRRDGVNYAVVDATIAMDHLILAATNAGLGTCWVAAFDPAAAREVLSLAANVEPVAFTPLGYPADSPGPKKRKDLEQLVQRNTW